MSQKSDHPLLQRPLYAFDLPTDVARTLQYKLRADDGLEQLEQSALSSDASSSKSSDDPSEVSSATSCTLCALTFDTVNEQRSHHRSDLHCYNLKQKTKGLKPVSEADFDRLIGDLDESLSGSDGSDESTDEESTMRSDTTLSALLKKQARLAHDEPETNIIANTKRKRGPGREPIFWFTTSRLPTNVLLGFYRSIFSTQDQAREPKELPSVVQHQQLNDKSPPLQKLRPDAEEDGGVALPQPMLPNTSVIGPHYLLCMMGGGHFAAMIVSLTPRLVRKNGVEDRTATVIAHKTFHRYTTRRKQGGSQSANDSAKGAAHSAGSSLRRYNETALVADIRGLLAEWKQWIDTSELLFIRATGSTNRRTLYGPYDDQVMHFNDDRIRGFPFNTRRATQAELMRAFIELTRVKVHVIDEEAEARKAAEAKAAADRVAEKAIRDAQIAAQSAEDTKKRKEHEKRDQEAAYHTSQIQALIRRSKAPALISYLAANDLDANYRFSPQSASAHHHSPTPLHLAAASNSPVCVTVLLSKTTADPTLPNSSGKSAFEVAGDRATRDAFRVARHELGETRHDWQAARVPAAMTKTEAASRAEREQTEEQEKRDAAEAERRRRVEMEESRAPAGQSSRSIAGKGASVLQSLEKNKSAQEKREDEMRGMTAEMRTKLERERRARAAEARLGLR